MASDRVLARIDPASTRFTRESESWFREREGLRSDLDRQLGQGAVLQGSPEQGDKGLLLVPIIVALGGAQFFQALTRAFEAWIKERPGRRSLTMTATVDGHEISVQIDAKNVSIGALQPFIKALSDAVR